MIAFLGAGSAYIESALAQVWKEEIGGVKRIGKAAELMVPFMAIGSAIICGVKRGVFSNEAGQGTGPQAAAAAEVPHPAHQGLVQAFSVYVDTLFVCSATGFMILMTGTYNVADGKGGFLVNNLPGIEASPVWIQRGIDTLLRGFGGHFVAIALFFFAFTTLMAYAFYTESNVAYLSKKKSRLAIQMARVFLPGQDVLRRHPNDPLGLGAGRCLSIPKNWTSATTDSGMLSGGATVPRTTEDVKDSLTEPPARFHNK